MRGAHAYIVFYCAFYQAYHYSVCQTSHLLVSPQQLTSESMSYGQDHYESPWLSLEEEVTLVADGSDVHASWYGTDALAITCSGEAALEVFGGVGTWVVACAVIFPRQSTAIDARTYLNGGDSSLLEELLSHHLGSLHGSNVEVSGEVKQGPFLTSAHTRTQAARVILDHFLLFCCSNRLLTY